MTDSLLLFRRERPAPDVPDEHLLSLCAAGNAAALDLLFRRHGDRVYRFLGRLPVVPRRDLEDLARATFVQAYREAGEYAERTSVSVWIIGIAVGMVRQFLASASRRPPAGGDASVGPVPPADGSPRQQGLLDRLARELADLPEELQLAFVLCDLEEIRGADVASMLGISRKALWTQVVEARDRLGAVLGSVSDLVDTHFEAAR